MITNSDQSYQPHRDDMILDPTDWTQQYRDSVAATGGTSTVSVADSLTNRLVTALAWDLADGVVVFRDLRAAGRTWRTLSGDALAAWAPWALGQAEQLTREEWGSVADRLRERVLAQAEARRAALPADVAAAEQARARQRVEDRRAEISAERARLDAEQAAIEEGASVPVPEPEPPSRGLGGWRAFRAL